MEVPQEERERFLNSRAGVSHAVINEVWIAYLVHQLTTQSYSIIAQIKQELARLQKEMEAKLHDLIDAVVEKVKRLQDILCVDETERAVHDACYGGKYTEEALDAHKVLLKKLEAKYKVRDETIDSFLTRNKRLCIRRKRNLFSNLSTSAMNCFKRNRN